MNLASDRGKKAVALLPTYLSDARSVEMYDPMTAPQGALQISVAENQMLEDLLVPSISKFSSSENEAGCTFFPDQIYYQPTHGRLGLRQSFSRYLSNLLRLPSSSALKLDNLIIGAGCNAVLENLVFCLAEDGDTILIPTPYYAAFEFDLAARVALNIIRVETEKSYYTENTNPKFEKAMYFPTTASLNSAYQASMEKTGKKPRILLLSNPNNPLGICYPKEVMCECISWARKNEVHLISDEIYAGSAYQNDSFVSALSLAGSHSNEDAEGLGLGPFIHFVYALSKDFALSGLRVGVAYSENERIILPMQKLNDLCQVSSQTQLLVERMLSSLNSDNVPWTSAFLQTNQKRIKDRSKKLCDCLSQLNIPFLKPDSGLFVWMDLSDFLQNDLNSNDEELERNLYLELMQTYGLLLTPGLSMRNHRPGFFRCVFTACSDDEFDLALERLTKFAVEMRPPS